MDTWKQDTRPARKGWSPGMYAGPCRKCHEWYLGDKRSFECADCAYATPNDEQVSSGQKAAAMAALADEIEHDDPFGMPAHDAEMCVEALRALSGALFKIAAAGRDYHEKPLADEVRG